MTRYGLIGTGFWARTVHAAAIAARPDDEFVGVWGRSPEKAERIAAAHGARVMSTPAELFAAVDVVAFAVPPDVQAPLAIEAATAGCHLLLEKPIALAPPTADELVDTVRQHQVSTAVFFTGRYTSEIATWLDAARAAGPWRGGRATWFGANAEPDSPFKDSPWRRRHGALWDVGPHSLAVILPLLGAVEDVTAVPGPGDITHLVLRHADGASSTVTVGLDLPPAAARVDAAVYGPAGWSTMPDVELDPVAALGVALDELADHAARGVPHPCDVALGRDIVHVLARATAGWDG